MAMHPPALPGVQVIRTLNSDELSLKGAEPAVRRQIVKGLEEFFNHNREPFAPRPCAEQVRQLIAQRARLCGLVRPDPRGGAAAKGRRLRDAPAELREQHAFPGYAARPEKSFVPPADVTQRCGPVYRDPGGPWTRPGAMVGIARTLGRQAGRSPGATSGRRRWHWRGSERRGRVCGTRSWNAITGNLTAAGTAGISSCFPTSWPTSRTCRRCSARNSGIRCARAGASSAEGNFCEKLVCRLLSLDLPGFRRERCSDAEELREDWGRRATKGRVISPAVREQPREGFRSLRGLRCGLSCAA